MTAHPEVRRDKLAAGPQDREHARELRIVARKDVAQALASPTRHGRNVRHAGAGRTAPDFQVINWEKDVRVLAIEL